MSSWQKSLPREQLNKQHYNLSSQNILRPLITVLWAPKGRAVITTVQCFPFSFEFVHVLQMLKSQFLPDCHKASPRIIRKRRKGIFSNEFLMQGSREKTTHSCPLSFPSTKKASKNCTGAWTYKVISSFLKTIS